MGVNISGQGVLSGIATLVAGVVNNLNLLITRVIGYTNTGGGGSSYYTSTVESVQPAFLAKASQNRDAIYSLDGINWNLIASDDTSLNTGSMFYAQEKFWVFTGYGNYGYSTNGKNWTILEEPAGSWVSFIYADNKFVMLGFLQAAVSTDGINWTTTSTPDSGYFSTLAFGNGKFVALPVESYQGTNGMYSTDGANWTTMSMPVSRWISLTFGNGKFVAITQGTGQYLSPPTRIFYSTDGINWTESFQFPDYYGADVVYGEDRFVVSGTYNGFGLYSTDGINWTQTSFPSQVLSDELVYGNGKFIKIGDNQGLYSTDGITWTVTSFPVSNYYNLAAHGNLSVLQEVQISIGDSGSGGAEILAPVDIYTVPANKTTDIDEVRVKNNSLNQITYDLGVLNAGVQLSDQNALINDQTISAGATATITSISTPLTSGQRIVVLPSAVDVVEVKVYGTETSV